MSTSYLAVLFVILQCLSNVRSSHRISFDPMGSDVDMDIIPRETVDRCNGDGTLDFSRAGLKRIPNHFARTTCITSISLEGNLLDEIPQDALSELPNLQCLNLADNRIPTHRYTTYEHEQLKSLILSHQRVSTPVESQEALEMVRYTDNEYSVTFGLVDTNIPVFPNLEYLDLSGSDFKNLPLYFNLSFPRLNRLDLTDRNIRDLWEDFVYKLPDTLKSLHFEKNDLTEIFLPYTGNIESLYFDDNPLGPNGIYIQSPILKVLSLSNCTLHTVSYTSFNQLPNLLTLDLSWNRLEELPEALTALQNLEQLSLSHNRLQMFPDLSAHARLRGLSLSYNNIGDLFHAISLPSLRRLSLRGNRISRILANVFTSMSELQELDLAENRLTTLPADWSQPLRNLRYLNLKQNSFASIADLGLRYAISLTDLLVKNDASTQLDIRKIDELPEHCIVHVA